jgi:hypothetical protein
MSLHRLLVFIPVWKRPEITEICFLGLSRLREYKKKIFKIIPFAVISEDSMIPLCEKYDIKYTKFENQPLGAKKNHGLNQALKLEWDYLMELNSDDLILNELLDIYKPFLDKGEHYLGLKNFCFMNSPSGDMRQMVNQTVYGIGRCYSREALKKAGKLSGIRIKKTCVTDDGVLKEGEVKDVRPYIAAGLIDGGYAEMINGTLKMWSDTQAVGLDNWSNNRLNDNGYKCNQIFTDKPLAVDIKSTVNIWPWNPDIGIEYNWNIFKEGLSKQEIEKIECLRQN